MLVIIVIGLALLALKVAMFGAAMLVDIVATAIAGAYYWRREHLTKALLDYRLSGEASPVKAWAATRAQRRLQVRSLRLSLAMTAHFSLFPASSLRGYNIAHALFVKA